MVGGGGGVSDGWWFLLLWLVGSVAIYTVYTIYTAPSPPFVRGTENEKQARFLLQPYKQRLHKGGTGKVWGNVNSRHLQRRHVHTFRSPSVE